MDSNEKSYFSTTEGKRSHHFPKNSLNVNDTLGEQSTMVETNNHCS